MTKCIDNPLAWESSFPPVHGHTSISYLKRCVGFMEAKHGDMQSAQSVVSMCVKPGRIAEIRKKYPYAVLLPVISGNKLPEALAQKIGMKTHTGVYETEPQDRKNFSAKERLLLKPCFDGKITKGEIYIIVDDIVTQGGTISALRKHVIMRGGTVAAVAALAFSADSRMLPPDAEDINRLSELTLIKRLLKEYNIADDLRELTRSQVKYLLRYKEESNLEPAFKNVRCHRRL